LASIALTTLTVACSGLATPLVLRSAATPAQAAAQAPTQSVPARAATHGSEADLPPQGEAVQFDFVSIEQGLSQSVVTAIAQDSKGFLWLGTQDGLNRYDGYKFVVYKQDPGDPNSLSANIINALLVDRSGVLWVGTNGGGLDRFDAASVQWRHYRADPADASSLSDNTVSAIIEDSQGLLWIEPRAAG